MKRVKFGFTVTGDHSKHETTYSASRGGWYPSTRLKETNPEKQDGTSPSRPKGPKSGPTHTR